MINVYLCDDNKFLLAYYLDKLTALANNQGEDVHFKTFSSGESLLFHLSENPNEADIIFMDIIMKKLSGIETARRLREMGCISVIIFLSSSRDFVFESFDVTPLNYIVKGSETEDEKMKEIFVKAFSIVKEKESTTFLVESSNQKKKIPIRKISFFEIHGRIITVHFDSETLDFYGSMDSITEEFQGKNFIRCHKSFLVNIKYIEAINKNTLTLFDGHEIPMGASYSKEVKLAFSQIHSALL